MNPGHGYSITGNAHRTPPVHVELVKHGQPSPSRARGIAVVCDRTMVIVLWEGILYWGMG
uniref:Uncharacterized protein n=1 Tax=Picea glauca TaxID=3330 RepID=A0A101M2H3_PICGL|nr:hypothetical protein ABT39_MTgene2981 [Picea glauca]